MRKLVGVAILLSIGLWLIFGAGVSAQGGATPNTPFEVSGGRRVQPGGADTIGDLAPDAAFPLADFSLNGRHDILHVQLMVADDAPLILATAAGESIEIPANHLAFAVHMGSDLLAEGEALLITLLIDSREGGLVQEALPDFTTDYRLTVLVDNELNFALSEFDDAEFVAVPPAVELLGGTLAVIPEDDGRDMYLIQNGAWAAVPLENLDGDTLRIVLESSISIPPTEDAPTVFALDYWPDDGWLRYAAAEGWRAEAVNILAGLDTRVSCILTAVGVVNVRSFPTITAPRVRQIQPRETATAISQTVGNDGFIWWRVRDGNWVRADVVRAEDACRDLPEIEP